MTGLWDFIFYILNLSQNRSKSKLVRENAMTRAPGSYSIYVMGSCPRIFLGLKFSIPGYFSGAKFCKYFLVWLDLSRIFWGIQNNMNIQMV